MIEVLLTPDKLKIGELEFEITGDYKLSSDKGEYHPQEDLKKYAEILAREREIAYDNVSLEGNQFMFRKDGVVSTKIKRYEFEHLMPDQTTYTKYCSLTPKEDSAEKQQFLKSLEQRLNGQGLSGMKALFTKTSSNPIRPEVSSWPTELIVYFTDNYQVNIRL